MCDSWMEIAASGICWGPEVSSLDSHQGGVVGVKNGSNGVKKARRRFCAVSAHICAYRMARMSGSFCAC